MQISEKTLTILKNVSFLNKTIAFKTGNVVLNISPYRDIFVKATIEEEFPVDFQIYDTPQLLNIISSYTTPHIDFEEESLTVSQHNNRTTYEYCDPNILGDFLDLRTKVPQCDDHLAEFILTEETVKYIYRSLSTMSVLDSISFYTNDRDEIIIAALDSEETTRNRFETNSNVKCEVPFKIQYNLKTFNNLKLLNSEYRVRIFEGGLVEFYSEDFDITYYVGFDEIDTL